MRLRTVNRIFIIALFLVLLLPTTASYELYRASLTRQNCVFLTYE